MRKSALLLLALAGCVRLNYVDIPAENTYKFKYVGEDSLVKCTDEKLAGRMCEKDGKTLANGSHINNNNDTLAIYINGKLIAMEAYWGDNSWSINGKTFNAK